VSDIEVLKPQMIERYLRERELRFMQDQGGHFIVNFYGDDVPDYRYGISIEGARDEVLSVRLLTDAPFPETLQSQAEAFVSGWNRSKRWPKAYIDDDQRGRGFWIIGENCFALDAGVHWELFTEMLDLSIATASQMLHEASAALTGVVELENWLREAG
jgi:Putative bacterial sensory transduction regulator